MSESPYVGSSSAALTRAVIVAVLSFVLGGLTFYAQGFLPDAAAPFANSSSGWTLLTAVLVFGSRFRPAAAGTAVLAGIGLGDGLFGLTVVHETTEPGYWWAVVGIAVILLVVMLVRRIRGAGPVIVAVAGSAAIAGAFLIVYQYVGARGLG